MDSQTAQVLQRHVGDPRFGPVIVKALQLLDGATIEQETVLHPVSSRSRYFARLYSFRKQRMKEGAALGLDESIAALEQDDVPVLMGLVMTSHSVICLWMDEGDRPLGVMVFKRQSGNEPRPTDAGASR